MWELSHPWWEFILRALIVYSTVFILLRLIGKKQIGQMSAFDLVLLLIISESVSNALTGGDNSISAGLISVSTFIVMNYLLDVLMFKSKKVEDILDGKPQFIIRENQIIEATRKRENITHAEIRSALREHDIHNLSEVEYAVLETNGQISVVKRQRDTDSSRTHDHNLEL